MSGPAAGGPPGKHARVELWLTLACIATTLVGWLGATWETGHRLAERLSVGDTRAWIEEAIFILVTQVLIYGAFVYQLTRYAFLRRTGAHAPLPAGLREALYEGDAPSLAILVPSYREELAIVRRSLISAALQDYPTRRVVLLIDDPPWPGTSKERAALRAMRRLPEELQKLFDDAARPFEENQRDFDSRSRVPWRACEEARNLAARYLAAAARLQAMRDAWAAQDHADELFLSAVLDRLIRSHQRRSRALSRAARGHGLSYVRARRETRRLAALFRVEITSFERKLYQNLSRVPNKAMNLNAYIGLLGGAWHETQHADGVRIERAASGNGAWEVPEAEFLITLDADSIIVPEYAAVLVHRMRARGNESMAVAQTPYSAFPGAAGMLERMAGATTDIQYRIHQGFTRYGATYWVGANALLRVSALRDIQTRVQERGFDVPVFIQDRTVIEDTESSVDLVRRGWSLHNYPERLAFSATPPDFGALAVQRERWANGGLLILPKLLRYLATSPVGLRKCVEGFFRLHYLVSIAGVNLGLLILLGHDFELSIGHAWLPLTAAPYFLLYARDLHASGYRASDVWRIYALNLLLLPVNVAGVLKSLVQAFTGRRVAFGRTPKVTSRTSVPPLYIALEYGLLVWWVAATAVSALAGHWMSAAFCLGNAAMLLYAITAFIGIRASWHDLSAAWAGRRATGRERMVGEAAVFTITRTQAVSERPGRAEGWGPYHALDRDRAGRRRRASR